MITNTSKLMAAAVLGGLLAVGSPAAAETPKDQLIIGMNMANFLGMDPAEMGQFEPTHVLANVYDTLVWTSADQRSTIRPGIATEWDVGENGDIAFTIRKGVKFHSGNELTPEDVAWSLQRLVKLNLTEASSFKQWGYSIDNVEEKIYVDGDTVVMEMVTPVTPSLKLHELVRTPGAILDKKEVLSHEKDGDLGNGWLKTHSAGSGPFKLNNWRPNDIVILERSDGYWGEKAKMKRVLVRHMPESQTARLQLERGDIDVAYSLSSADYRGLEENDDIEIQDVKGGGFYYFAMNGKDPDLGKPAVRDALRWCIDYEGINNSVMAHYGSEWKRLVASDVMGALPDLDLKLDVDRCKSELAAAGYPDGLKKTLRVITPSPFMEAATAIQATMAKAGVELEIIPGNGSQTYGAMRKREFETLVGRGGGGKIPDPHFNLQTLGYNPDNRDEAKLTNKLAWRTAWNIPGLTAMTQAAAATVDEKVRERMYEEIQILAEALVPTIQPFAQRIDPFALRTNVKGYQGHPTWITQWETVSKE